MYAWRSNLMMTMAIGGVAVVVPAACRRHALERDARHNFMARPLVRKTPQLRRSRN